VLAEQLGIDTDAEALPEGRALLGSSDFYTVYQSLGRLDGVESLWCWAHIRRYFIRAGDAHPQLRAWAPDFDLSSHWRRNDLVGRSGGCPEVLNHACARLIGDGGHSEVDLQESFFVARKPGTRY
ncbi:MAG: IS66 family transposase, partial [Gemmatimonadota bacterium]|nr:IS66 family transposase [Gemmatimonadota bacterium]